MPGCAWPDPRHTSSFEFCENGAKAVSWEATGKRATPELFAAHTLSQLWEWSDHALEGEGRLTHPMAYDAASDRYLPISWEAAFERIGAGLRALPDPDMAEFYTSGRTSNEAAFLYQLMVREYGTNNFPDCFNCATSHQSACRFDRRRQGTVTLEDFDHCDALFSFGHNPAPTIHVAARCARSRDAACRSSRSIRCASAGWSASLAQDPGEMLTNIHADRTDLYR